MVALSAGLRYSAHNRAGEECPGRGVQKNWRDGGRGGNDVDPFLFPCPFDEKRSWRGCARLTRSDVEVGRDWQQRRNCWLGESEKSGIATAGRYGDESGSLNGNGNDATTVVVDNPRPNWTLRLRFKGPKAKG